MTQQEIQQVTLKMSQMYTSIFVELDEANLLPEVEFYSDVYDVTYGQAHSSHELYGSVIKRVFGDRSLVIGELFAGQGFELEAMRRNISTPHEYIALDIDHYYHIKHSGIQYLVNNHITGEGDELPMFDLLFCGEANISHSSLTTAKEFQDHVKWASSVVNPGGIFMCSVQNIAMDDYTVQYNWQAWPVVYGEHKGKFVHWFGANHHDPITNRISYSNLCALSEKEVVEGIEDVEQAWSVLKHPVGFRNWSDGSVIDFVTSDGFTLRKDLSPQNPSVLLFQKD